MAEREYEFTVRTRSSAPDVERYILGFEKEVALHWPNAEVTVVHREIAPFVDGDALDAADTIEGVLDATGIPGPWTDDLDELLAERMTDPEFAAAYDTAERRAAWRMAAATREGEGDGSLGIDPIDEQVARLALFIMEQIEGEPSQSQGAVDTAIRLLAKKFKVKGKVRDRYYTGSPT